VSRKAKESTLVIPQGLLPPPPQVLLLLLLFLPLLLHARQLALPMLHFDHGL